MNKVVDMQGNEVIIDDTQIVDVVIETEDVTEGICEPESIPAVGASEKLSNIISNPITFSSADFTMKCFRCGAEEVLEHNVRGGLRFDMYTTDQHAIQLTCATCGTSMKLYFKESQPIEVENEQVLEEDKI